MHISQCRLQILLNPFQRLAEMPQSEQRSCPQRVSIITPCRNEAGYIEQFVAMALGQIRDGFDLELIIAEGDSDDGTRAILSNLRQDFPQLKVVDNPKRIVSTGLNLAIELARGEAIVRMDVHTRYEADYVSECVKALTITGAGCVGGPWRAEGLSTKQSAIADAFQSPIGSGGASSRRLNYDGPCDTVYLGCWWKEDLVRIGGFDETLVRNQDDELCLRLALAGHSIWQSSSIRSCYMPRSSAKAAYRQFFQYGYWKVAVAKKHGTHAALRHVVPFLFVSTLAILWLAALFNAYVAVAATVCTLAYIFAITLGAWSAASSKRVHHVALTATALMAMHFGYGVGYGLGLWDFRILNRVGAVRGGTAKLTR